MHEFEAERCFSTLPEAKPSLPLAVLVSGLGDDPDFDVSLFQNVSGHDSGTVVEGFVVELFVA